MTDPAEFSLFSSSILRVHKEARTLTPRAVPLSKPHYAYESLVEGCYHKFIGTVFDLETDYKLEAAQKWITFPGKHRVQFPLQTILPKVQMIRKVSLKQLPRDVEVDRRRKRYNKVRISELLLNEGISNSKLIRTEECTKKAFEDFFLPLHIFDDESFDSNSITGWLDTGLVEGQRHPLPGWALIKNDVGVYFWEMVAVYSYDEDSFQFTVIDLQEAKTHQVYRIHLMFMAENPYLFVERIMFALNQRNLAEARIRYQILLDCVLYDEVAQMNQSLLDQIFKLSLLEKKDLFGKELILHSIVAEIRLNYQRVMISYLFEAFLKNNDEEFYFIETPPKVLCMIQHSQMINNRLRFEESQRNLRVITLFYVTESIQAMLNAAAECVHIESFCLFVYHFVKPVTLPDFVTIEEDNCSTVIKFLKYVWPENVSGKICLCLRSIGKGWLDLSVSDWNVFNVAKISRFFLQVKFRMQGALQVVLEKSILNYSHLLNDPCLDFLHLKKDYRWTNDFRTTPFDRLHLPPIFKIVLHLCAEGPFYSTDPNKFEPTVTELLYTSLMSTCGIRIIDADSLLNLNFAKNLYISTVELIEEMYIDHAERLHASYSNAVIPLNAYLVTYKRFVEFHELVVDEYIQEFVKAAKSSQEVKNEILWQKEQKEELKGILPEQIVIGPFQIIVEPLKKYLVNKRIEIIRKLFLYYIERMYNINEQLLEELLEINGKLHEKLVSIEHLFEIKNYMILVPDKLTVLRERIQIMMLEYNVLDSFFYNLTDQQFSMKWEAYAWPYRISKRLIMMKEEHKIDIEEFKRIQIRELASFQERLESLNEEIMAFSLQFDPEKALEVAVETKKTWKIITDLQKLGTLLQERQILFEAEEFSLDYLDSIIRSFNPYRAMWTACSDFIKLEEITVGNPLSNIDLNEIRENLEQLKQILEKSVQIFNEKEEVQKVAMVFLDKIEKFYPILEVIVCIKNEHWLILHWQEFALRTGIDIKFTVAMNFSYCMKKGILSHIPLVKEIAERAVLEADAIRLAMEEEERSRREAELTLLERKMNRKCRMDIL